MNISFIFLIFLFFGFTFQECNETAGDFIIDGYCYHKMDAILGWQAGENECKDYNSKAHLVSLTSNPLLEKLWNLYNSSTIENQIWIGLNKINDDPKEEWEFSDGSFFNTSLLTWREAEHEREDWEGNLQDCVLYDIENDEIDWQSCIFGFYEYICQYPICDDTDSCTTSNPWDNLSYNLVTKSVDCELNSGDNTKLCPSKYSKCFNHSISYTENNRENNSTGCNQQGLCTNYNNCVCFSSSFEGEKCLDIKCNGVSKNDEDVCSGHGQCYQVEIGKTKCDCDDYYFGSNCEETCPEDFTGLDCEIPICNGINGNTSTVCSGKGECISQQGKPACVCNGTNILGDDCEFTTCFGIINEDMNSNKYCSGNGNCVSFNKCECKDGYSGEECDFKVEVNFFWESIAAMSIGGLSISIILLVACIVIAYYVYRQKKLEKRFEEEAKLIFL